MLPNAVVVVYLFSAFFLITRGLVFACARALNEKRNLWRRVEKSTFLGSFFLSVYGAYIPYVGRKRGDNERSFLWLISWYIGHFNFKALKRSFDVARLKEYSVAKIAREVVSGGSHYCIFNTRRKRFVAVRCRRACVLPDRFMYVPVESYVGLLLCDEFSQRL